MRVVIAPDSFGGTLTGTEAAAAIAEGWLAARPEDDLVRVPMSDGGEGLLDALAAQGVRREVDVVGVKGLKTRAAWLDLGGGEAVIESAQACGLALLATDERDPLRTTSYGVGQLLDAARQAGARIIHVGLGGSATIDGGTGALLALGLRLLREDGNGLKQGGGELVHLDRIERGWLDDAWDDVEVDYWIDVLDPLSAAPRRYGPQKGLRPDQFGDFEQGLARLADVAERDLGVAPEARVDAGSGAAGGLGYGLRSALGGEYRLGALAVARRVGLEAALDGASLLITGEGRLDDQSTSGKVVTLIREVAKAAELPVAAVVGQLRATPEGIDAIEQASPGGPGDDPYRDVRAAAERLASRL